MRLGCTVVMFFLLGSFASAQVSTACVEQARKAETYCLHGMMPYGMSPQSDEETVGDTLARCMERYMLFWGYHKGDDYIIVMGALPDAIKTPKQDHILRCTQKESPVG